MNPSPPQPHSRPSYLTRSLLFLLASALTAVIAFWIVFTGIIPAAFAPAFDDSAYAPPTPLFRVVNFDDMPGWREDNVADALPVFLLSCEKLAARKPEAPANALENLGADYEGLSVAGAAADWAGPCEEAGTLDRAAFADDAAWRARLRRFFEERFTPVEVLSKRAPREDGPARGRPARIDAYGVFTGYFEPEYEGRLVPQGPFTAPLFARPDDLIDVELGLFHPDLAGERVAGRLEGTRLVPYPDRNAINQGALNGRAKPMAWLDPDDLFFLQIQGSGRIRFEDGTIMRVGYAGANGRPYTAIGRILVERGAMTVAEASMQSIRDWLSSAHDDDARALRETNASYVFFRKLDTLAADEGPLGAQGAPLTAGRSLAVDRRFHALGAPVFVDIEPVASVGSAPIRRLMIAQDTGGAIRGPVRGDVFWGAGEEAAARAGSMNASGRMFVLLPKARADFLAARETSS